MLADVRTQYELRLAHEAQRGDQELQHLRDERDARRRKLERGASGLGCSRGRDGRLRQVRRRPLLPHLWRRRRLVLVE